MVKEKIENSCIGFFQTKKNCYSQKLLLPENLSFQNLLNKLKLLPDEKSGNTMAFDKLSKRKLLSLISADSFISKIISYTTFRVEICFMP